MGQAKLSQSVSHLRNFNFLHHKFQAINHLPKRATATEELYSQDYLIKIYRSLF